MESIRSSLAGLTIRPGLIFLSCVVLAGVAKGAPPEKAFKLGRGSDCLTLNPEGALLSWGSGNAETATARPSSAGEIRYGGNTLKLTQPTSVSREGGGILFTYRWPGEPKIEVIVQHRLTRKPTYLTWTRELQIRSETKLALDLTVALESGLPALPSDTWLPMINGVGAPLGTNVAAAYRFAGALPRPGVLLALPMLSVPARDLSSRERPRRWMIAADPYFSVLFTPTALACT